MADTKNNARLQAFLQRVKTDPASIEFEDTLVVIDHCYRYTPTAFRIGTQVNAAGQNQGSCKILAFGQLNALSEQELLACYGRYYREDVCRNPAGEDHPNIRQFMQQGWAGVEFHGVALSDCQ